MKPRCPLPRCGKPMRRDKRYTKSTEVWSCKDEDGVPHYLMSIPKGYYNPPKRVVTKFCKNPSCGVSLEGRGSKTMRRPLEFCSSACKQAAYRQRKHLEKGSEAA